jgi:3-oxoacyl-[acyl-carrier-protein] synthase I
VSVVIAGHGARTPVGLSAPGSAAAVRAGISRIREHPFLVDAVGDKVMGAYDGVLEPRLFGVKRLLALAASALAEARGRLATPVPVFLGLPERRPGFGERELARVREGLAQLPGVGHLSLFPEGHAAGLAALDAARRAGHEVCLVGGVDSYFDPDAIEWLDDHQQLARADIRSGLVPGEGAAFLLLADERVAKSQGWPVLARVRGSGVGRETKLIKTPAVCLADGLRAAIAAAAGGLAGEHINDVICDLNGERYRTEEWGFVCLKPPARFDDPAAFRSPADCWGDVGAASGPLFAVLACQAMTRGYARGPRTLVWASSEAGLRAAALIEGARHV